MVALRRQCFPAPRPMASRQVVLLTPLESSQPQVSPSRHRINRVNRYFPVVDPLYVQALTGCPSANPFLSMIFHFDGGVYPHPRSRPGLSPPDLRFPIVLSSLAAIFAERAASVATKGLTLKLNSLDATLTKNRGSLTSEQTFNFFPAVGVQLRTEN
jgi:hypothetical protein